MKILYITTIGGTMHFFKSFIKQLIDAGHTVDIATNEEGSKVPECYRNWNCTIHQIDCCRSPLNKGNLVAIGQIKKLVENEKYDIVHCHTPIAAMCTRLACRNVRKHGTKVFYTAHGFHFYKGAPLKNWLMYYPVEKLCAHFTDILITINQEDYALAEKKLKAKKVVYVPGVGIDLERFGSAAVDKKKKRQELGIPLEAKWLLNVGELNPRKNQETLIKAVAEIEGVYLTIAGTGPLQNELKKLIDELRASERIKLLGFRSDIAELCNACDIFAFASFREGLPVSVMEAMASKLPVVCSSIRGNIDLIDENGGMLFDPHSVNECRAAIESVIAADRENLGAHNKEKIKNFSVEEVNKQMWELIRAYGELE